MSKQWYVLRVASNREEQVREALERKVKIEGLEERIGRILVPTDRRPRPRTKPSEKKFVERKLYPGYVFIEMDLEEDGTIGEKAWFLIKETSGVGDFIGSMGKPTPMSVADAEKIPRSVSRLAKGLCPVDIIRVTDGADHAGGDPTFQSDKGHGKGLIYRHHLVYELIDS